MVLGRGVKLIENWGNVLGSLVFAHKLGVQECCSPSTHPAHPDLPAKGCHQERHNDRQPWRERGCHHLCRLIAPREVENRNQGGELRESDTDQ